MDEAIDVLGLSSRELSVRAGRCLTSGSGLAGRIYERAFESGRIDPSGLGLSEVSQSAWLAAFRVGLPKLQRLAQEGETAKAVFELSDGCTIESVRIPMPGDKSTLCVSSQVGCAMGCAFCETGRLGLVRNLRAEEIVGQVLAARVGLGWDCGNIVFMGMGECLDNLDEVERALEVLSDVRGLRYSLERITLCTSAPPGGIERLRELGHKRLGLSLSLNAGDDEKRSSLMPINRANGLEHVAASLAAYPMRRNFAFGVNWCLMPGINDSRADAAQAAAFCKRIGRCVLNLIPYNPGSAPIARAPSEEETERFASWLEAEGCLVKRRATKGAAIMAGCGQLGGPLAPSGGRGIR